MPNSKFIPLEGLGHGGPLITEVEKVNNLIWNFIQENLEQFNSIFCIDNLKIIK